MTDTDLTPRQARIMALWNRLNDSQRVEAYGWLRDVGAARRADDQLGMAVSVHLMYEGGLAQFALNTAELGD